jgi:hypothetical protein
MHYVRTRRVEARASSEVEAYLHDFGYFGLGSRGLFVVLVAFASLVWERTS